MKEDARSATVAEREKTNEDRTEKVRSGAEQFWFMLETNPQIKEGLAWFDSTVSDWDMQRAKIRSKTNQIEHSDSWALQRDVNYAYSDRQRLFDIGHDTRFESAYQTQFRSLVMKPTE